MTTIFLHLGKFQPAEVRNFQPAQTGEFSTGTDSAEISRAALSAVGDRRSLWSAV